MLQQIWHSKERMEETIGIDAKLPFYLMRTHLHWHEKIIMTSTGERRPCEPTKQKLFRWRLPVQPDLHTLLPLSSFDLVSHLTTIFPISWAFYYKHCLPRGHGGWATWDQTQVCFNNIGVPPYMYSDWP